MKLTFTALTLGIIFDFIIVIADAVVNYWLTPVFLAFVDETVQDPSASTGVFLIWLFMLTPLLYLSNIVLNRALISGSEGMKYPQNHGLILLFNSFLVPILYLAIAPILLFNTPLPDWLMITLIFVGPAIWGYLHWLPSKPATKTIPDKEKSWRRVIAFILTFPFVVVCMAPINSVLANSHLTSNDLFGYQWWLGPINVLCFTFYVMIIVYLPRKILYRIMGIDLSATRFFYIIIVDMIVKTYGTQLF